MNNMSLIISKITDIKSVTKKNIKTETKKLATLKSISELLSQIDFSTEEVPINDKDRLEKLLISLKGEKLTKHESKLVCEIIE
jgi:hypothetical protein